MNDWCLTSDFLHLMAWNVFSQQEKLITGLCTIMGQATFQGGLESRHLSKCVMTKQLQAKEPLGSFKQRNEE